MIQSSVFQNDDCNKLRQDLRKEIKLRNIFEKENNRLKQRIKEYEKIVNEKQVCKNYQAIQNENNILKRKL